MVCKKKKAFTLTELLVVVVIIGVLAAVVLPKFTKVIETRKTTEAEEMMAAVRTEQEARCSISKNYTDISKLKVYKDSAASKDASPNFTYANNSEGVGMIANAKSQKYSLKMPSYADGRICCDGNGCAKLNKDYPTCEELTTDKTKYPDFIEGNAECGIPGCDTTHQEGQVESTTACECGGNKYTKWTCSDGTWTTYEDDSECKPTSECGKKVACDDSHYEGETKKTRASEYYNDSTFCGWVIETWQCNEQWDVDENGNDVLVSATWEKGVNPDARTQPGPKQRKCPYSNDYQYKKYSCVNEEWTLDEEWSPQCPCDNREEGKQKCESKSPSGHSGTWYDEECACECPQGTELRDGQCVGCIGMQAQIERCEYKGSSGWYATGTWNYKTCQCECPEPESKLDGNGYCAWQYKGRVVNANILSVCDVSLMEYSTVCSDGFRDITDCSSGTYASSGGNASNSCNLKITALNCKTVGKNHYSSCKPEGTTMLAYSYDFYVGGELVTNGQGDSQHSRVMQGGRRLGSQGTGANYFTLKGMPDCSGSDYDGICNSECGLKQGFWGRDCKHVTSGRNYRCVLSKNISQGNCVVTGCVVPSHWAGTGQVLECISAAD